MREPTSGGKPRAEEARSQADAGSGIVASETASSRKEPDLLMRAFAIDEFGANGSIHQVPIPEPGAGEVLVAVHAAGVNVMDPLYVAGAMKGHMEHRFPLIPGIDFAGVVERTGPGVDGFAAGDAVTGVSAKRFARGWHLR